MDFFLKLALHQLAIPHCNTPHSPQLNTFSKPPCGYWIHIPVDDSIFHAFDSKPWKSLLRQDTKKFPRIFLPVSFYSLVLTKSSISLLILFSTTNWDTSWLEGVCSLLFFFSFLWCGDVIFALISSHALLSFGITNPSKVRMFITV